ncbi:MAG: hypothetical protein J3T61_00015, partial [Candidatus Brocadiales bacterium]|nr:hypothetical protein [Candidatus Bathyanammoxibius sp.]
SERTVLWRLDIEDLLRDFTRRCALDVVDLWDAPDVVVRYLKTGDESLRDAARAAARDAKDAARAAARDAKDAAGAAARAAKDAAGAEQNRRLTSMIMAARKAAQPPPGRRNRGGIE